MPNFTQNNEWRNNNNSNFVKNRLTELDPIKLVFS